MSDFHPIPALVGGAMIGLASVMLMAFAGRIAGTSGIAQRLFPPYVDNVMPGRIAYLAGLIAAPGAMMLAGLAKSGPQIDAGLPLLLFAGALVGFGSVWGNGCTSGHGVCGIARLSIRSFAAAGTFTAAAMVSTYIVRHVL
ncbi:MAG: YeeE/YedE family protein [Alphaproteobacteria bacterium]|nr:YeeE/YedE family protein [Alphaproteobacteria bacterium]